MTHDQRDEDMMQGGAGVADFISQTLRNRPEALLLMAAGAALMMTRARVWWETSRGCAIRARSPTPGPTLWPRPMVIVNDWWRP